MAEKRDYLLVVVLDLPDGGSHWEERCEPFYTEEEAERGARILARITRAEMGGKIAECYAQEEPA